ncbi:hypothetical protein MAHJHV55_54390 [Mycobacterium avium subsp. hominissuis]
MCASGVSTAAAALASENSFSLASAAAAVETPLAHTVELNAGTVDTEAGPGS